MAKPIRRVVTGHNAAGRSMLVMDGAAPHVYQRSLGSAVVTELWETRSAPADNSVTLLPAAVTTAPPEPAEPESPAAAKAKDDLDTAAVFAKLKQLGGKADGKDDE